MHKGIFLNFGFNNLCIIHGLIATESISEKQDSPETAVQPSVLPNSSLHEAADVPHIAQTEVSQEETQQQTTSHTHPRNRKVQHSSVLGTSTLDDSTTSLLSGGGDPLRGEPTTSVEPPKQDSMLLAFRKFRTMFVLLVGFLVRVAFMYDFGKLYIQVSCSSPSLPNTFKLTFDRFHHLQYTLEDYRLCLYIDCLYFVESCFSFTHNVLLFLACGPQYLYVT